jgi:hypothetical protein
MMRTIGAKVWAIPGGHVPLRSSGEEPRQTSRDELCVLNAGHVDVSLQLTIYAMPLDTPYAALLVADHPVVVQFTRHDTSQAANAIATTLAFPG